MRRGDEEIPLTYSEFEILHKLAGSPRRVFTREELMNHLWKGNFYGDLRSVDVHVRHLRQKVEQPSEPVLIRTVRGVGCAFGGGGREGAVKTRRALGLQGWLVAALLAVGLAASLAVLLVVLPTLESSVQTDRAKREAQELRRSSGASGRTACPFGATPGRPGPRGRARRDARRRGRHRVLVRGRRVPGGARQRPRRSSPRTSAGSSGVPMEPTVLGDGDGRGRAALRVGGGSPTAGSSRSSPSAASRELAIVRRRVIIAMIVVLGLAALAGIALARVLGGRIRRLASTAATLAGGDLSARASDVGVAPEELQVLRRSINGMAERLESLVGAITSERDRDRAMIGSLAEGVLVVGSGRDRHGRQRRREPLPRPARGRRAGAARRPARRSSTPCWRPAPTRPPSARAR